MKKIRLLMIMIFVSFNLTAAESLYNLPNNYQSVDHPDKSWSSYLTEEGISLLKILPFKKSELPVCVSGNAFAQIDLKESVEWSIDLWNESGRKALGVDLFRRCDDEKAKVHLTIDFVGGNEADKNIKFAEVFLLKSETPKVVMILREKELKEFGSTIDQLIESAEKKQPGNAELKAKLQQFKAMKISTMVKQILAHELGHVIGLGHNFNKEEESIMDYSSRISLSPYDFDALKKVFLIKTAKKWRAKNKLE